MRALVCRWRGRRPAFRVDHARQSQLAAEPWLPHLGRAPSSRGLEPGTVRPRPLLEEPQTAVGRRGFAPRRHAVEVLARAPRSFVLGSSTGRLVRQWAGGLGVGLARAWAGGLGPLSRRKEVLRGAGAWSALRRRRPLVRALHDGLAWPGDAARLANGGVLFGSRGPASAARLVWRGGCRGSRLVQEGKLDQLGCARPQACSLEQRPSKGCMPESCVPRSRVQG